MHVSISDLPSLFAYFRMLFVILDGFDILPGLPIASWIVGLFISHECYWKSFNTIFIRVIASEMSAQDINIKGEREGEERKLFRYLNKMSMTFRERIWRLL